MQVMFPLYLSLSYSILSYYIHHTLYIIHQIEDIVYSNNFSFLAVSAILSTYLSIYLVADEYRNKPLSKDTFMKVASTLSKLFPDKNVEILETIAEGNIYISLSLSSLPSILTLLLLRYYY